MQGPVTSSAQVREGPAAPPARRVQPRRAWRALRTLIDDPERTDGLFLLTDGNPNQRPNPLLWQGSRLEARFMTVYTRPRVED